MSLFEQKPYRIAVAGLGTVGAGVLRLLQTNEDVITQRAGRRIEIAAVSAREKNRKRGVDVSAYRWVAQAESLAAMPDVDAVIELIGGEEGPALSLARASVAAGKDLVTANKAMLAHHGYDLALAAEEKNVGIGYEAAIAGCVPVVKAIRESFAASRMTAIHGILNGTSNYILSHMRMSGRDFSMALKEAQHKGYAEAEPSLDVEGQDTAHKLCLLAALAFNMKPQYGQVRIKGITRLTGDDIAFADELGFRIKLLGVAQRGENGVMQSVEPCLVPVNSPLGFIEDVYNAVFVSGDYIETPLLTGRGAGQEATAAAVVGDIIDLARGRRLPMFGIQARLLESLPAADPGAMQSRFYIRLTVLDRPGVIADVSAILRDHSISIESIIQRGRDPGHAVPLVMTTHEARQDAIRSAYRLIADLPACVEEPSVLRIEDKL